MSIVEIRSSNCIGTGFLVSPNAIVTCRHVVQNFSEINKRWGSDRTEFRIHLPGLAAIVLSESDSILKCEIHGADIAVIVLNSKIASTPLSLWSSTKLHWDDRKFIAERFSSERYYEKSCEFGLKLGLGIAPDGNPFKYQITYGASQGFSGAPVYLKDDYGKNVIGMVYLGGEESTTTSILSSELLQEFLKKHSIEFPLMDSDKFVKIPLKASQEQLISGWTTLFEGPGAAPALPVAHYSDEKNVMQTLISALEACNPETLCVVVTGIGGLGKTSLARQLVATKAKKLFPDGSAWLDGSNFISELSRVSRRFGWIEQNDPLPSQAASFLRERLHERAFLLVVDNFPENADASFIPFPGGKCRTLITSRRRTLTEDLAGQVKSLEIKVWSPETSRSYLREVVPRLQKETDADLDALHIFVQGLPLAVRLIARSLLFSVSRSAKQHLKLLNSHSLSTLDSCATALDRGVTTAFSEAYNSLSEETRRVLQALAVCASGTCTETVAHVVGYEVPKTEEALNILVNSALAEFREETAQPWGMHDVVRLFVRAQAEYAEYAERHVTWVREHLRCFSAPIAHVKLDRGIEEAIAAFKRLITEDKLEQADEILTPIFSILKRTGRFPLLVDLIKTLLANLSSNDELMTAVWLGNLGLCYESISEIPKALDLHGRALEIYRRTGSLLGQATTLGNLGLCYGFKGDFLTKAKFHSQALEIGLQLSNFEIQANNLGSLGGCFRATGDIQNAIASHNQALKIYESLKKLDGQASQSANMGSCYLELGEHTKAIKYFEDALSMTQNLGLTKELAEVLGNLGLCYEAKDEVDKAIEFGQRSLEIFENLHLRKGQADQLSRLSFCFLKKGKKEWAINLCDRSFGIHKFISNLEGQAITHGHFGLIFLQDGKAEKAIESFNHALKIFKSLNNPQGQAMTLDYLGTSYRIMCKFHEAFNCHQSSLALEIRLGRQLGQAKSHFGLGICFKRTGEKDKAKGSFEEAFRLYRKIGYSEKNSKIETVINELRTLGR